MEPKNQPISPRSDLQNTNVQNPVFDRIYNNIEEIDLSQLDSKVLKILINKIPTKLSERDVQDDEAIKAFLNEFSKFKIGSGPGEISGDFATQEQFDSLRIKINRLGGSLEGVDMKQFKMHSGQIEYSPGQYSLLSFQRDMGIPEDAIYGSQSQRAFLVAVDIIGRVTASQKLISKATVPNLTPVDTGSSVKTRSSADTENMDKSNYTPSLTLPKR